MLSRSFSATVASRFEIVDEELKDKSENETTKNSTEYCENVFKKWANERNFQASLEEHEGDVLDQTLLEIYALRNSVSLPSMLLKGNRTEWILVKLRINIIGVFRSCRNCPRRCAYVIRLTGAD